MEETKYTIKQLQRQIKQCNKCLKFENVSEKIKENHINKLEKLLQSLEVFGFIEVIIK